MSLMQLILVILGPLVLLPFIIVPPRVRRRVLTLSFACLVAAYGAPALPASTTDTASSTASIGGREIAFPPPDGFVRLADEHLGSLTEANPLLLALDPVAVFVTRAESERIAGGQTPDYRRLILISPGPLGEAIRIGSTREFQSFLSQLKTRTARFEESRQQMLQAVSEARDELERNHAPILIDLKLDGVILDAEWGYAFAQESRYELTTPDAEKSQYSDLDVSGMLNLQDRLVIVKATASRIEESDRAWMGGLSGWLESLKEANLVPRASYSPTRLRSDPWGDLAKARSALIAAVVVFIVGIIISIRLFFKSREVSQSHHVVQFEEDQLAKYGDGK